MRINPYLNRKSIIVFRFFSICEVIITIPTACKNTKLNRKYVYVSFEKTLLMNE